MAGYIAGGAIIGAASSGATAGVSAAGGGAFVSGAAGGAVSGASFATLGAYSQGVRGNELGMAAFNGAWKGAVSGGIGGWLGGIGGIPGSFVSGMASNASTQFLNNGYDVSEINWGAAAVGGLTNAAIYTGSSYLNYQFGGGKNMGDMKLSFRQYMVIQADYQRSRFLRREIGRNLLADGGVGKIHIGTNAKVNLNPKESGSYGDYHIHWDNPNNMRVIDLNTGWYYQTTEQLAAQYPQGTEVPYYSGHPAQYHGVDDYNNVGWKTLVINRYDASYSAGNGIYYTPTNPPLFRYNLLNFINF